MPEEKRRKADNTERPRTEERNSTSVQSIVRAGRILQCLGEGLRSVSDIADRCDLHRATVHRLLKTLTETGLVVKDPLDRQYYFGSLFARMVSNPHITHQGLIICAIRPMRYLSEVTDETVVLSVMQGFQHVRLHAISSRSELRVIEDTGPMEINPGTISRVLLSQLGDGLLELAASNISYRMPDDRAPFNKEAFLNNIERIRRQGYDFSTSEKIRGACCISFAVKNYIVPVALNLLGPENRVKPKLDEYLEELKLSVVNIEHLISQANLSGGESLPEKL